MTACLRHKIFMIVYKDIHIYYVIFKIALKTTLQWMTNCIYR